MPAATSVVINDREPTPVAHTFEPDVRPSGPNDIWTFTEAASSPVQQNKLQLGLGQTASGVYQLRIGLYMPTVVTETINGVDSLRESHFNSFSGTFNFAKLSTDQERQNLVGLQRNLLDTSQTMIMSVINDLLRIN